jgi:hypothetical protein
MSKIWIISSKALLLATMMLFSGGCANMTILKKAEPLPSNCDIRVFSSLDALKSEEKPFEELCIITGTSSGSFSHTVATAINKHKQKACKCGANAVYLQAQDAGTLGTASATLVGIKISNQENNLSNQ